MASLSVHHFVNQLKFARSLQSVAEEQAGGDCGARRVLSSYWVGEDSTQILSSLILSIKLLEETLTQVAYQTSLQAQGEAWADIHRPQELRPWKGHKFHYTIGGSHRAAWRQRNTLQLHHYC